MMQGVIANHLEECSSERCPCIDISQSMDNIKKVLKTKRLEELAKLESIKKDLLSRD